MDSDKDLGTNKVDITVTVTKGLAGAIPFAGSLIAEVIGVIIPNQRLDRVVKFIQILEEKISKLDQEQVKSRLSDPGFVDLFEDGLNQAMRALTDERKEYIASIVKNSLSDEQAEYVKYKKILSLLGELNEAEVIILSSYHHLINNNEEFYRKHKRVLGSPAVEMNSSQDEIDQGIIHQSYRIHLLRLGLLRQHFKKPRKGELPEFDEKTGMMKADRFEITPLGSLLLRYSDLIKEQSSNVEE